MSSLEPQFIQDFTHFEQHVAKLIHKADWTVETAKTNQPGYDLVVKKGNLVGVVQVKWLKGNVTAPQLLKFADFLDSDEGKKFNFGWFVTTKGFGGPALALIRTWGKDTKVRCGIAHENPENPASRLAFDLVGGRCYPREDFINLADYIEREAGIGIFRAN
ncbi:restriction endonuclease [Nostoc sp. 'Peltigera membranacea cyanobiont' 232]|uniref:restriction endonuclease n=1 Tax=Nostoc sp. 'Peltigera membranacea cyanobiont' 232 TaxID=2014531 RepID=UPI001CB9304C|nr:restriction endonuclease [Nostoc sp. 'Peltigera membranacea cyanobiont' 232]